MWVRLLEGRPPKNWEHKKRPNFGAFLTTFDFDREYLRNGSVYPKSEKKFDQLQLLFTLGEKNLVNFGPRTKTAEGRILTHPSGHFSGDYISALRVCCPLRFLPSLEIDLGYLANTLPGRGLKHLIAKI